jgi:dipeptidyl aminopeptidase/acylaminoacyl peptidase
MRIENWTYDWAKRKQTKLTNEQSQGENQWRNKLGATIVENHQAAIAGTSDPGEIIEPKLSPDGRRAIYRTWSAEIVNGHEARPIYIKHLDGRPHVNLFPGMDVHAVNEYWWGPDGKTIYAVVTPIGRRSPQLFVVDPDGNGWRQLTFIPFGQYCKHYSVDRDMRQAVCLYETNTTPAELSLINLKTGEIRVILNANPEFSGLAVNPVQRLEWTNKYGQPGLAYLMTPRDMEAGKAYPVVVTLYDSGDYFIRGGTGDEYPAQAFASRGIVVLAMDLLRFPPDKSGDFAQAMLNFEWPMADLEAGLLKASEVANIDRTEVAITGLSRGAVIAEFAISHSSLFRAAITSGGSYDPLLYYVSSAMLKQVFKDWGLSGLAEQSAVALDRWAEYSPALNAQHIEAPLLINAADHEYVECMQLFTTLQDLRKPVELFVYPDEFHIKKQPRHRLEIYNRNIDWVQFWLQGLEDPERNKIEQYRRWRRLRDLQNVGPVPVRTN